jgi:hypothetical protein
VGLETIKNYMSNLNIAHIAFSVFSILAGFFIFFDYNEFLILIIYFILFILFVVIQQANNAKAIRGDFIERLKSIVSESDSRTLVALEIFNSSMFHKNRAVMSFYLAIVLIIAASIFSFFAASVIRRDEISLSRSSLTYQEMEKLTKSDLDQIDLIERSIFSNKSEAINSSAVKQIEILRSEIAKNNQIIRDATKSDINLSEESSRYSSQMLKLLMLRISIFIFTGFVALILLRFYRYNTQLSIYYQSRMLSIVADAEMLNSAGKHAAFFEPIDVKFGSDVRFGLPSVFSGSSDKV